MIYDDSEHQLSLFRLRIILHTQQLRIPLLELPHHLGQCLIQIIVHQYGIEIPLLHSIV